jgi:hypothetical protein
MRDRERPDAPTGSVSDRPVQRRAGAGLTVGRLGELPRPPLVDAPVERRARRRRWGRPRHRRRPRSTIRSSIARRSAATSSRPAAIWGRTPTACAPRPRAGVAGPGEALPHGDAIARSFGPAHELSSVRAHVGGAAATAAAAAIGATAYATGADVAFAAPPDLHTAAHEAAHVVQQRAGVHLAGGVGADGDPYERHADAVADRVVAGRVGRGPAEPNGRRRDHRRGGATRASPWRRPRRRGARRDQGRAHGARERLSPVSALPRDARSRDRLRGEHDQRRQRAPARHHAERRLVAPARGCAAGLRLRDDPRLRGEDRAVRARLRGRRRRGRVSRSSIATRRSSAPRPRGSAIRAPCARAPRPARRLPRPPAGPGASRRRSPARRDVDAVRLGREQAHRR